MAWQEIDKSVDMLDMDMIQGHLDLMDEIRYVGAARRLRGYPVGVGEDHEDRRGRDATIRLIKNGFVRRLFLECNSNRQQELNELVGAPKNSKGYTAKIAALVTEAGPAYQIDLDLGDVAVIALKNLVLVHFIDLDTRSKTHWKNLVRRDAHAADKFNEITARTGTVGCLVLFGAEHFTKGKSYRGQDSRCLGELLELSYVTFT